MEMIVNLGLPIWTRRGPAAYLRHLFASAPVDIESLDNPEFRPLLEAGIVHMVTQGAAGVVHESRATMADWRDDYRRAPCPVHWLAGAENPVTSADELEASLMAEGCASFEIVRGAGSTILVTHFSRLVEKLSGLRAG
jgi:hypothetical protein